MGEEVPGRGCGRFFLLKRKRKNTVLTEEKVTEIQRLYYQGDDLASISIKLSIKQDTLEKAVRSGRIKLYQPTDQSVISTKSDRAGFDNEQVLGKACGNVVERILSCKTNTPCKVDFANQVDLNHAGVLLSLPALLSNGLLIYEQDFYPDQGYYSVSSVFMCLSFLALLRIKTLGQSSLIPAGELGKAIGLDRIPEVKTLRERIALFCSKCDIEQWGYKLSKSWLEDYPDLSGVLYIDGHVNIYYGGQTAMPKRYVSRLRLCMSGSTDYWVNDRLGQPYFVINKTINSGMIQIIKEDIVPRLNDDIPNQPTAIELNTSPYQHRYMLVFDRECYSPDFFHDLWQDYRIAICTYNKNVKDKWPDEEFSTYRGKLPTGHQQELELAERGVLLQNKSSKKKIWAREVRKKSKSGHQTSIITTNYLLPIMMIGLYMFSRWSQENFFKYMMQHFGIDALVSYLNEKVSETETLVNPAYRTLENQLRKVTSKLNYRKAKFGDLELGELPIDDKKAKRFLAKKAELRNEIELLEQEAALVKQKKKQVPRKIQFSQLPETEKFDNVINDRKAFLDIIKMIAYRAETAMANRIKPHMSHPDEARKLLQQVYQSDANLWVDKTNNELCVELHRMSYWKDDKTIQKLCEQLNETKTKFPGTNLTIFYKLVSLNNP